MPFEPEAITLRDLVRERAAWRPDAVAIVAPGRPAASNARLAALCDATARTLAGLGLGSDRRVALLLPDGAETAAAFVCVAAAAACAPVNPGLTPAEIAAQLDELRPGAILIPGEAPAATLDAVRSAGAAVLALEAHPGEEAGCFTFAAAAAALPAHRRSAPPPAASDPALVLHTSGTTSRPKRVPLTQANLAASARHVATSLALGADDRCLTVMPLFHVHGLVAAVLAPLASGGSIACPGGFQAALFFDWLDALQPTWYTAVPTMHQAILAHAERHAPALARTRLRFVRSSSASLPPAVLKRLEAVFGVPVVEAYGMTEAAHQITSNPLPPRPRKPGSVGRPAGPEVAVLDEIGRLLPNGATGEVAIRGPNVLLAYEDNPQANAAAFADGWFRTGDLGAFDAEGYLFLQGRRKELINRGGEKVAPREVEEVLLEHPAVAEAVVFPVPDAHLGETVGAAVVLREGAKADLGELRAYAAARLSHFKLPAHVVLVGDVPKGPTGKLQRAGLAARLGLGGGAVVQPLDRTPPRTPLEARLRELWSELLGVESPGVHAGFLELGGDSLTAVRLLARVRDELRAEASLVQFFETPTIAGLAAQLASGPGGEPTP